MLTDGIAVVKDLEIDGFVTITTKGVILLGILNFLSSRSSFFFDLALLGSLNRIVKMF
jgi:hypothetical protein